ncbi:hypothetical protein [Konateibacter massiliensis]|uniref:hypothetical protein n=1 Tax=Konateibacter massiliensis TaxID=2002841 RepID=UPI000C149472|nr:hypothetical protein [Konateibacter massiliensis]
MKQNKVTWDYLWYALYAFAGLGIELLLVGVLEPMLFGGVGSNDYTPIQRIIHWILTIICWGVMTFFLINSSKKKLDFDVISVTKPTRKGIMISIFLAIACIGVNAFDWGILKVVGEFQSKGLLLFVFQYIYYWFEVMLVVLILAFGQKFGEALMGKMSSIPWGGIILCCTWGAIHTLTQGSLYVGIGVMAFALVYGMIYLLLNRNFKYAYIFIALAFMI